jgi:hypothetical protein
MGNEVLVTEASVNSGTRKFLNRNCLMGECTAAPAIILRHIRKQQTHLAGPAPNLGARSSLFSPSRPMRHKLLRDELASHAPEGTRLVCLPRRFVSN